MGVDRGLFLAQSSNSMVIVELANTSLSLIDKVIDALFFCLDLLLMRLMRMHTYCQVVCIVQLCS